MVTPLTQMNKAEDSVWMKDTSFVLDLLNVTYKQDIQVDIAWTRAQNMKAALVLQRIGINFTTSQGTPSR